MSSTSTKMKPCPFCGGRVLITVSDDAGHRWVSCDSCQMDFSFHQARAVKDIDRWLAQKWNHWVAGLNLHMGETH